MNLLYDHNPQVSLSIGFPRHHGNVPIQMFLDNITQCVQQLLAVGGLDLFLTELRYSCLLIIVYH